MALIKPKKDEDETRFFTVLGTSGDVITYFPNGYYSVSNYVLPLLDRENIPYDLKPVSPCPPDKTQ